MGFLWLLGCSQVACRLHDHFAGTIAHLWAICALSVAVMLQIFVPLYIIGVLNTQRFSTLVLDIGDFCGKKAYIAYRSCCIIITSAIVYFFNKSF